MATDLLRRAATLLVVLTLAVLLPAGPAPADVAHTDGDLEHSAVTAINAVRSQQGLDPLTASPGLTDVARRHSEAMAASRVLHHDPAVGRVVEDWRRLGENVGRGSGVTALHTAFMASPTHAANVLAEHYDEVGVGVVVVDGEVWMTQVFRTR